MTAAALLQTAAATLGVGVDIGAAGRLVAFLDAVLAANARINLTGIRDRDKAMVLHALDSLAAGLVQQPAPARVLDLGSGNGFPGAGLATLYPTAQVVLCERRNKKVEAMSACVRRAGLQRTVLAACVDAEQAPALRPEWRRAFHCITARGVGDADSVAKMAAPLLADDGTLVLWLDRATVAAERLGRDLHRQAVHAYSLPEPAARERQLAVYRAARG